MKDSEIVVGGVYVRTSKRGRPLVRLVLNVTTGQDGQPRVEYGPMTGPLAFRFSMATSLRRFALWAQEHDEEMERVIAEERAKLSAHEAAGERQ